MNDYVAVAYGVDDRVKAFTTGTLECCKSAARTYKRKKNGFRVYPVVKIMSREEWESATSRMQKGINEIRVNF